MFLLQGLFPIQGLNPGLPHCRRILYCLSYRGSFICSSVRMFIPNSSFILHPLKHCTMGISVDDQGWQQWCILGKILCSTDGQQRDSCICLTWGLTQRGPGQHPRGSSSSEVKALDQPSPAFWHQESHNSLNCGESLSWPGSPPVGIYMIYLA